MADLPKRTLGRTGLEVTVLGFGAGDLRGPPRGAETSEAQAERVLKAALDAGINYFETSHDAGLSEGRIGKYLSHRRDEFLLCTKAGCLADYDPQADQRLVHLFTPENIIAGVNLSLSRLRTDYIDVLLFHAGPSRATLEEHGALQTALDLKQQGKVRFIGVSALLPEIREHVEMEELDVLQIGYSALDRSHEALMATAAGRGFGVVARNGGARGVPGRQQPGQAWDVWQQAGLDDLLDGMSRMEFTLRFTCTNPDLDTTVVATVNADHLQENVRAVARGPLPPDLYAEAKRRLSAAGSTPAD